MRKKISLWVVCFICMISISRAAIIDLSVVQTNMQQCDTSGLTTIYLKIKCLGSIPFNGGQIQAGYQINNGTVITQNFNAPNMISGDSVVFPFTVKYDFNQFTSYNCKYFINNPTDGNNMNDTVSFTRTFFQLPGFGAHSNDTSVCVGNDATLMMELTGNGPWMIDFASGLDTIFDMPIDTNVISLTAPFDSSATFTLIEVSDVNGCSKYIGQSITISVYYTLDIDLGSDTSLCAGNVLLLDAGYPGASYNWWDNSTTQTVAVDTASLNGGLGLQQIWVSAEQYGCSGSDTITIDWVNCLGVGESENIFITLYPNPVLDIVTLESHKNLSGNAIRIFDSYGRLVRDQVIEHETSRIEINVSDLTKGVYLVKVIGSTGEIRKKILKQ